MTTATETVNVPAICTDLQALQRQRAVIIKSRNMQSNRLQAIVAGTLGYSSNMPEKDRKKKFAEATALIKAVNEGKKKHSMASVIRTTLIGIDAFNTMKNDLQKAMVKRAKSLPVATWVQQPGQRGFGLLFLAIVIGECGDLSNYANPGKLWKRLGCAPWSFNGKTAMGATWRAGKEGKLPSEQWEAFGYSPRRRSIAYLIGDGIVKQNRFVGDSDLETELGGADECDEGAGGGDHRNETEGVITAPGPYLTRYLESKASAAVAHPDWTKLRCHRHGMLLATKLLLKNLWIEWNMDRRSAI